MHFSLLIKSLFYGENELHGYPAPAEISEAANDELLGRQLWEFGEKATGLGYPF
jgi:hypothetical protein